MPTSTGRHEKPRTYKTGPRYACWGALRDCRWQIQDLKKTNSEVRSQKSKTNVSGEHLLPLVGGGKFGSPPGAVPQSGIATSTLNV